MKEKNRVCDSRRKGKDNRSPVAHEIFFSQPSEGVTNYVPMVEDDETFVSDSWTSKYLSFYLSDVQGYVAHQQRFLYLLFHWSFVCLEAVSRILSRKKNSNGSLLSNTQIKRPMKKTNTNPITAVHHFENLIKE